MYKEASFIDRRPLALGSARAMGNFDSAATAQLVGPARSHERRVRDSEAPRSRVLATAQELFHACDCVADTLILWLARRLFCLAATRFS